MEKSLKNEIIKDLKELKERGVKIEMHDSYLERAVANSMYINHGGSFVTCGSIICGTGAEAQIRILKQPSELTVHIYLNSQEEEILNQIKGIKKHIETIDNDSKSSAIVDFIKESGI